MARHGPDPSRLGPLLRDLRAGWDGRRLDSDPLELPHRYAGAADREVVAFLAAALAFGRVASIRSSLDAVLRALGPSPADALASPGRSTRLAALPETIHRWVRRDDLAACLDALSCALSAHGSLGALLAASDPGGPDAVDALDRLFRALRRATGVPDGRLSHGLRFLLPLPADGSACKRAHLLLRWMVRSDGFDLGLWASPTLTPARLLLPLDTHVFRIVRHLGLTRRRTADLAAAREATAWLRRVDPADPVSFDWALSRIGILGLPLPPSP